jgi:cytochrome bd ubiquinol oxidase subunit II
VNLIFEINYGIFAIFASLLITEIIGSVVLLLFYDVAKNKVLEYIVPVWEVTGTFAAFWVVTGDFAYPGLLIPVATIFGALLTIFLILLVARNTTIVFAEFIIKKGWLDAKKLYKGYALSTILLGVTALILLSSLVSGAGVLSNPNPLGTAFNFLAWASKTSSWLFVLGTLLIGVGLAPVFFDVKPLAKKYFIFTIIGVAISIGAYYAYSPGLVTAYIAIPSLLTIVANLLYFSKTTASIVTNKAVFITALSIIIFSLQPLIYPKFVGQAISIDSLTTNGAMALAFYEITLGGGVLLAIMIGVYVMIAFRGVGTEKTVPTEVLGAPTRKADTVSDNQAIDSTTVTEAGKK